MSPQLGHHEVGLGALVGARPVPQADALGAVLDRGVHVQELQVLLLVAHDDVDVVGAPQAVVRHRQQAVRVRRQVDAGDRRALVDHDVEEARVLVREAVVVLAPDRGGDEHVERGHRRAPRQVLADVQPLGVLVEHRVDHVHEGFVGREEAVATGEQVALEPALERVLGEHFHDPAVRREFAAVGVHRQVVGEPGLLARLVDGIELVRGRLVRAEHAEVVGVELEDVAQELAELARVLDLGHAGLLHRHGVVAEIGHAQRTAQPAAVRVRVRAHAARTLRRQCLELLDQPAVCIEQLLWPVALHPLLEQLEVVGVVAHVRERHLVRAPVALDCLARDLLRPGPALGAAQHDHRPARHARVCRCDGRRTGSCGCPARNAPGSAAMSWCIVAGIVAFDEMRRPAVAAEQGVEFLVRNAREDRGVVDLVAVQVQHGQHGAVAHRVQELVRVPGGGERSGFGFTVADHDRHQQVGVVEGRAEGVRDAVAQLAALVDGSRRFRACSGCRCRRETRTP